MNYYIPTYTIMLVKDGSVKIDDRPVVRTSEDVQRIMQHYFGDTDREHFYVILLNAKNRVIGVNLVSTGSLTSSLVHPREVYKPVVAHNDATRELYKDVVTQIIRHSAAAVILSHNHPSGDPNPSQEDKAITRRLREVGDLLGVSVLDHVIIGDQRFFSMRDEGCWE